VSLNDALIVLVYACYKYQIDCHLGTLVFNLIVSDFVLIINLVSSLQYLI